MATPKVDKILVSLDCILDTRIGTLNLMDADTAKEVMMSDTYHFRDEDVFGKITKEAFKETYAKRDEKTLENSLITNLPPLLKHLIGTLLKEGVQKPYYDGVELVVNIHPYNLTKEIQDEIKVAVSLMINDLAEVSLINYSIEQLTPQYCKANYRIMIMYEYNDWLNNNAELFASTQLPEVTLFAPALYFAEKPSDEKLKEFAKDNMHPFQAIEMITSSIIDIALIDVKHFSIINEKD